MPFVLGSRIRVNSLTLTTHRWRAERPLLRTSDLVCGPHLSQMQVQHHAVTIEAHQVPYEPEETIATIHAESAAGSE